MTDQQYVGMILDHVFSPYGVAIFLIASLLICFLVVSFFPPMRRLFSLSKWRAKLPWGTEVEHEPSHYSSDELALANTQSNGEDQSLIVSSNQETSKDVVSDTLDLFDPVKDLFLRMRIASDVHDQTKLDEIVDEYIESGDNTFEVQEVISYQNFVNAQNDVEGALQNLKDLEAKEKSWIYPSHYLAKFYSSINSTPRALEHIEIARTRALDEEARVKTELAWAEVQLSAKNSNSVIERLLELLDSISTNKSKSSVLRKLSDVWWEQGLKWKSVLALEMALRFMPEEIRNRFQIALRYGEEPSSSLLSLYHYRIILKQNPNHLGAKNNLASTYSSMDLNIESIRIWKDLLKQNESYSASNIAIALAKAGFIDEANGYINDLPSWDKNNQNVKDAENFIYRKQRNENKKLDSLEKEIEIYMAFADEAAKSGTSVFTDLDVEGGLLCEWIETDGGKLTFEKLGNGTTVSAHYETKWSKYEMTGRIYGRIVALRGRETQKFSGRGLSLLTIGVPAKQPANTWYHVSNGNDVEINVVRSGNKLKGVKVVDAHVSSLTLHGSDATDH